MVTSAGSQVGKYVEISEDGNTIAFSNNPDGANNRIEIFRTSDGTRGTLVVLNTWKVSLIGLSVTFLFDNDGNRIAVLWDTSGSGAAGISVYEYSESWAKVAK